MRGERDGQVKGLSLFPPFSMRRVYGASSQQALGCVARNRRWKKIYHQLRKRRLLPLFDLMHLLHGRMCRRFVGISFPKVFVGRLVLPPLFLSLRGYAQLLPPLLSISIPQILSPREEKQILEKKSNTTSMTYIMARDRSQKGLSKTFLL